MDSVFPTQTSETVFLALNYTFSDTDFFNLSKSGHRKEVESLEICQRTRLQGGEEVAEIRQLLA